MTGQGANEADEEQNPRICSDKRMLPDKPVETDGRPPGTLFHGGQKTVVEPRKGKGLSPEGQGEEKETQ